MTDKDNETIETGAETLEELAPDVLEYNFRRIFTFLYGDDEPPKAVLDQARYFFFGGCAAAFGSDSFNKTVDLMEEVINDAEIRSSIIPTSPRVN